LGITRPAHFSRIDVARKRCNLARLAARTTINSEVGSHSLEHITLDEVSAEAREELKYPRCGDAVEVDLELSFTAEFHRLSNEQRNSTAMRSGLARRQKVVGVGAVPYEHRSGNEGAVAIKGTEDRAGIAPQHFGQ